MALKAILADLDGFLYAYAPCNKAGNEACFGKIAAKYSVSLERAATAFEKARGAVKARTQNQAAGHSRLLYFKQTVEDLSRQRGEKPDYAFALQLEELFWQEYFKKMAPYPGVKEFFAGAKARGLKVCIVTDLTARVQLEKIIALGLQDFVDCAVTSEEAGVEKPDAKIFIQALKQLGVEASEAVMLGDDAVRDQGAQALGVPVVISSSFWKNRTGEGALVELIEHYA